MGHPLSAGTLANAPLEANPLPALNAAWSRFRPFMVQAGSDPSLLPVPISTLGGRYREAHRAVLSIASGIAS